MRGSAMHYSGTVGAPIPPCPAGFVPVAAGDLVAMQRARELAHASGRVAVGAPATLGDPPDDDALAPWSYRDELLQTGLYRFFLYEHPAGHAIGAMRLGRRPGTLGEHEYADLKWSGAFGPDEQLGPEYGRPTYARWGLVGDLTDPTLAPAAQAVMDLFASTPPDQNVHAEVSAFQTAYNAQAPSVNQPTITVDGQYGPCTMVALQNVLNAEAGSGPPQQAPNTAFPGQCQNGVYVPPPGVAQPQPATPLSPPVPPPATPPAATPSTTGGGSATLFLVLGGLVAVGAAVAGIASHKGKIFDPYPRRRRRRRHASHAFA